MIPPSFFPLRFSFSFSECSKSNSLSDAQSSSASPTWELVFTEWLAWPSTPAQTFRIDTLLFFVRQKPSELLPMPPRCSGPGKIGVLSEKILTPSSPLSHPRGSRPGYPQECPTPPSFSIENVGRVSLESLKPPGAPRAYPTRRKRRLLRATIRSHFSDPLHPPTIPYLPYPTYRHPRTPKHP